MWLGCPARAEMGIFILGWRCVVCQLEVGLGHISVGIEVWRAFCELEFPGWHGAYFNKNRAYLYANCQDRASKDATHQ